LRARKFGAFGLIGLIVIGSSIAAWDRGANYFIANQISSFLNRPTVIPANDAVERLERAAKLAPDVSRYWHDLAKIEQGRAAATQNPQINPDALSRAC
jgi:hypothetical protein